MSNAVKLLLFAATIAIVILVITLGSRSASKGKNDSDANMEQYNSISSEYEQADLKIYEGAEVTGSEIKDLIRRYQGDEFLSVKVINGKKDTEDYINESEITNNLAVIGDPLNVVISDDPSAANYINDNGEFTGEVIYDANGVVACLRFTQQ